MNDVTIKLPDWEMNVFEVYGVNPKTKRKKSETVVIVGDDKEKAMQKSGLIEITSVELIEQEPPSNAQIKYGNDLGIEYKSYYTKRDYTALISIAAEEEVYIPVDKDAAEFAAEHDIYLSQYASMSRLYRYYYHNLSLPESVAFFAFTVYQAIKGFVCYDYQKHPQRDLFLQFSEANIDNGDFTKSLLEYEDTDEFIPNYGKLREATSAYQICYNYFAENGIVCATDNSLKIAPEKEQKDFSQKYPNQDIHESVQTSNPYPPDAKKKRSKSSTFAAVFASIVVIAIALFFIVASCNK